jgi:membrane-associated protein
MDTFPNLIDLVLHLDKHLALMLAEYGTWIYAILFLIIFMETGLVVTPFLPGDSLLFVAGTLAAGGGMHIGVLIGVLLVAAVLGDNCNFWVGRKVGPKVFRWEQSRLFNRKAFDKTHAFYEKHGGVTLILARFMPVVRTFACRHVLSTVLHLQRHRRLRLDLLPHLGRLLVRQSSHREGEPVPGDPRDHLPFARAAPHRRVPPLDAREATPGFGRVPLLTSVRARPGTGIPPPVR